MKKYEAGLDAFLKLRRYHKVYSFPAAHLFAATCYIRLKRYMEASENIETGMGLCGLQDNISLLHWPGTGDVIEECLLRSIKVEFERLQIQVAQKMEAIGSCCFASCTSKQITRVGPGFEGYCVLKCSENCTLMFHHNCWKKEKEAIGCIKDKNVISINCLTSDCPGVIIYAVLYDMDERPRFEIGEQTSSNFKKQCKSLGGVGGMSSLSRTSSSSSCELNNKGKKQEELDNTKGQDNDVTTDVAKQPIDAPPTKQV
jgi:E3 ubiquitin-protein ligase TTC3